MACSANHVLLIPTDLAPSRIHGLGVVTRGPVSAGTPVWRFQPGFDVIFGPEAVRALPESAREFLRHYAYLDAATSGYVLNADHGRFMNHSETPNTGMGPGGGGEGDTVVTVALCDLPAGTELTCDYRAFDADVAWKLRGHAG